MVDRVGQQLGNYIIVRKLGEGGFAEVYLGEHIHLGTYAAIKVLHTQLLGGDTDTFRQEARTVAHLIHPISCVYSILASRVARRFWSWTMLHMAHCVNAIPEEHDDLFPLS